MSYSDIFASVYDMFMEDADYRKRTAYIHGLLKKYNRNKGILLDLACGTGKFSVNFSNLGYDVIGVDISPDMLMKAKENAEQGSNREILFLCQDMTELDLYGTVDACICCMDSLNHISDFEGFRRTLNKVSLFMNKGGIFIFDVNTLYKHRHILAEESFVYENEDTFLVWQNSPCVKGTINIFLDFFSLEYNKKYSRFSEEFTETAYSLSTIKKELINAGFKVLHCYDDLSYSHPKFNSDRVYFVAQKV